MSCYRHMVKKLVLLLVTLLCLSSTGLAQHKVIRVGVPYLPQAIDPLRNDDPVLRLILSNLSRGLISPTSGGYFVPDKSNSYFADPAGLKWGVAINPTVQFLDSEYLRADALARYYLRQRERCKKDRIDSPACEVLQSMSGIAFGNDPLTGPLIFSFETKNSVLDRDLLQIPLLAPGTEELFGKLHGNFTSLSSFPPYEVYSVKANEEITLRASRLVRAASKYHDIQFRAYDNPEELLLDLRNGVVLMAAVPESTLIERVKSDPTLEVYDSPLKFSRPAAGWKKQPGLEPEKIVLRAEIEGDTEFWSRFALTGLRLSRHTSKALE